MPTTTVQINNKCSHLVVTTSGDPITNLDGRLSGNNIKIINFTYEQLQMKRKAQVLKYISQDTYTKKQNYTSIVSNKGYYSKNKLLDFINSKSNICPDKISSSSCSGVFGSKSMNYYNDPNVPYYTSI